MPRKICECCRISLRNAYNFKLIIKRADTSLKMYPMTGNVPPKIDIPQEMLPARKSEREAPKKAETKNIGIGCEQLQLNSIGVQTDDQIETLAMIIDDEEYESVIEPPAQFSTMPKKPILLSTKNQPKVLSVKILNKARPETSTPAKQFRRPSQVKIERVDFAKPTILNTQMQGQLKKEDSAFFESTADGNIQIITYNEEEYLEDGEWETQSKPDKSDVGVVYSCNHCERSFTLLQQLEIHKINHTRERNHPCKLSRTFNCSRNFLIFLFPQANTATSLSSRNTISPSTF